MKTRPYSTTSVRQSGQHGAHEVVSASDAVTLREAGTGYARMYWSHVVAGNKENARGVGVLEEGETGWRRKRTRSLLDWA